MGNYVEGMIPLDQCLLVLQTPLLSKHPRFNLLNYWEFKTFIDFQCDDVFMRCVTTRGLTGCV